MFEFEKCENWEDVERLICTHIKGKEHGTRTQLCDDARRAVAELYHAISTMDCTTAEKDFTVEWILSDLDGIYNDLQKIRVLIGRL